MAGKASTNRLHVDFYDLLVGQENRHCRGYLLLPPAFCRFFCNFLAALGAQSLGPRLAAHAPQRHGGGVLAVLGGDILDLAGRDLGDQDGVADGVAGRLSPLGPLGMSFPPYNDFGWFDDLYGVPSDVGERNDG